MSGQNKAKANEADVAIMPTKADEADAKANEANKVIVIDEAIFANDTDEANNVIVAIEANAAVDTNEADEADLTSKAVEANEAKDAIVANEADELNELDEANEAGLANKADVAKLLLPFSLTKCSAFFSEDKGYFGIWLIARSQDELNKLVEANGANNNQHQGGSLSSLITWIQN
jgi:hypothetical protein